MLLQISVRRWWGKGVRNSRPQQSINCTQFSGVGSHLTDVTFVVFSANSVELKLRTKQFTRIKTTNFKLKDEETLEKGTYFQTTVGDVTTPDCVDTRNNGCLQEPMKN